ncbi:S-adenosyl-L-methionine-dependent methyltransferase [Schizothecium vesticola]|uniref:S-adenosyl-L-methionine-dependent methyltransferase n=1 Tax=Schizothecium vesticola TaxID=314040 RepID=A0AA40F3U0_9PEZI|nr:S-adenosyl-L-methionine-dependent methyltransferase [Schizothecium vesticola]
MANSVAIAKAEELLEKLRADDGSPATRAIVLRQLEKIRISVQQPPEAMGYYTNKGLMMVLINLCVQLGVFDAFPPGETASAAEIAAKVDVDVSIISRFLRALLLEGLFTPAPSSAETADQSTRYAHTAASLALHGPDGNDLWRASIALPIDRYWKNGSDYFRTHTLAETQDPLRSAFAWSTGHEGLGFFAALEQDRVYAPIWKRAMALLAKYQLAVVGEGMFPWHTLREEVEAEGGKRPLLVDVGGGKGGASVAIREACGGDGFGAEVVLEDLPIVLEAEGEEVRIEGVRNLIYDFFAGGEQPVKNAHVYYFRKVLHDYYDDKCQTILRQVVKAMAPTSRVILCEYVMPEGKDLGGDVFPYLLDFLLFMVGGLERTETQWRQLLGSVGLEVVNIWRLKDSPLQADIEARLRTA